MAAWMPTYQNLGHLPHGIATSESFQVEGSTVPQQTTEIQVYAYISLHGLDQTFQRGYYEIYTESEDGKSKFMCYMNLANVNDSIVNSDNIWLPFGNGIKPKVFVTLQCADGCTGLNPKKPPKKNHTGSMKEHCNVRSSDQEDIFAEAFITVYKVGGK